MSVTLAVAVNLATNAAPRWIIGLRPWAWALVIALGLASVGLAVWQQHLEGSQESAGVLSQPRRGKPQELPRDVTNFTARACELSQLHAMARKGGIVAIAGKPGVGKSALAIHAAHSLSSRYPDGQVFLDLHGLRGIPSTAEDAMLHVIRAFARADSFELDDDLPTRYRSVISTKRAILILDDAENESQVRPLLPPNNHCLVLITSRRALAGLTEAPPPLMLDTLDQRDAIAMLGAICGSSRIDSEVNASMILVEQCGALPLALRIAGARLRRRPHWGVATLVAQLSDERHRLDELRLADMEVRACIALSYNELSSSEATSFRKLAAIPGHDFGPEIAAAAIESELTTAQSVLDELADVQLLEQQGATRFRFHDLIRLFAEERFREEETPVRYDSTIRHVLLAYATQLDAAIDALKVTSSVGGKEIPQSAAREWEVAIPFKDQEAEASRWLHDERDNILSALYAAQDLDDSITWRLARPMLTYLENRSSMAELRRVLTIAERATARLNDTTFAMSALYFHGRVARLSGKRNEAINALQSSADYFLHMKENAEASEVLLALGQTFRESGALREASDALVAAFQLRIATNDNSGAAGVLIEVAIVAKNRNRLEDAAFMLTRAISLLEGEAAHDYSRVRLAWAHENLGAILKHLGRTREATEHHEASLAIFTELDNLRGQAYAMRNLGDLALRAGMLEDAEERYINSLTVFRKIGDMRGQAQSLGHLAIVRMRTHHWAGAVVAFTKCLFAAFKSKSLKATFAQLLRSSRQGDRKPMNSCTDPIVERLMNVIDEGRSAAPSNRGEI